MDFMINSFDIIIDKGCLDVIFCSENSFESSTKALKEIYNVLKHKGLYILMTNSGPEHRKLFL